MSVDHGASIGRGTVQLTLARLSSAASLFGVTVIAARLLTPTEVGSAAVGQVVGTAAALLASGGLNISTIYFLRRRGEEGASLVGRLVPLAIASATLAFLLALASAPVLFGLVLGRSDWLLLASAGALGASIIGYEFVGSVLLGLGHAGRYVAVEVARGWGSLLAVTALLLAWSGAHGFVLGLAAGFAVGPLLSLGRIARDAPMRPRYDASLTRDALRFGSRGQVGNILQFLGTRLDLLIVPALLDLRDAGIYFIAVRVSDLVGQAATAAASFLFPHVAGQEDRGETRTTERVTRATLLVTIGGAVAIALLAEPLLSTIFGATYATGAPALLLLLAGIVPLSLGRLLAADLKGRGRPGTVSVATLIGAAATVVLDLALIPAWGIVGAAVSSVVAYSLMAAAMFIAYRAATGGLFVRLLPGAADARELGSLFSRRMTRRRSTDR